MEAEKRSEKAKITEIPSAEETPAATGESEQEAARRLQLPEDLPAAYEKLLAEKAELYDRLLRAQAELDNFRKRIQREKEEFLQHANTELISSLLPTLDSFERALEHRDAGVPAQFYEGLELIHRHLMEMLSRAGLRPVEASGKLFDPEVHQAVETVEVEGARDHEVVGELQRGYRLKHRLLRPAIVKVAVPPKDSEQD
ncbi:MAG: nucleotide exchange factor GrpE [Terriglobia bacterium]